MKGRGLTRVALALAVAAIALTVSGAGSATHAATPFKVAFILVGPHNDGGWSQAHVDGMNYVQKALGSKVQTTYKENIAVGSQFDQTVASLVSQGYKMIFATSYGYITPAIAKKYPNVLFEQATGDRTWGRTCRSTSARLRIRSSSPAWPPVRRRRAGRSATSRRSRSPR